ncbi:hypothetical protein LLG95_17075 [bacterium]|nr:hypothetical protein [bacterium]
MGLLAAAIPDDSTVERLRKQIEERQQQRRDAEPADKIIELHELGTSEQGWPDLNKAGDLAVIRLVKESASNLVAVRLVPIGRDVEPIQIPSWGRGDQWISIDPGRWRLELSGRSGLRPDSETKEQLQVFQLTLDRRGRYELNLNSVQ